MGFELFNIGLCLGLVQPDKACEMFPGFGLVFVDIQRQQMKFGILGEKMQAGQAPMYVLIALGVGLLALEGVLQMRRTKAVPAAASV